MRRTNTILSILLSFLIFITVFQQFNINYETMLELNYSAAIDKNTNDTFVIKSVLNVENLDNSTKEKLMDFSSKHDATINITYAGPPYIKGKESLTYLTFGPQANEIYNKIFTENNEFFDLNNVLETKVLTNIASDTPIYPNRVQIDSIASQSNLISRNHVTFIGSFYYFEQIIEELEQNYLTVGIQVEKESYSYLEMTQIIEETGYLTPMVSSIEIVESPDSIVTGIIDDGILGDAAINTNANQVQSITMIVGFIFLMNLIFFFFQQRDEIFVRQLLGNKIHTIYINIIFKELIIITTVFFITMISLTVTTILPLRPISFEFLKMLRNLIYIYLIVILVLSCILYILTLYFSKKLKARFEDVSIEFSLLNLVVKIWIIFIFIIPISNHLTTIRQAYESVQLKPLLNKVKDSYKVYVGYIVGYEAEYDSKLVFETLNTFGFDAIDKKNITLSFEKNMNITNLDIDVFVMNQNRFDKTNIVKDIDNSRNAILIPQSLHDAFDIEEKFSRYHGYEIIYYDNNIDLRLTDEERIDNLFSKKKIIEDPIIILINNLDSEVSVDNFVYYINNTPFDNIHTIDTELKKMHTVQINNLFATSDGIIKNAFEIIKFELPFLLILVSALFLLTYQILVSSYYAMRDLFANQLLFGTKFLRKYWFYYFSSLGTYFAVYFILYYKENKLFYFYKYDWLLNLSMLLIVDLILMTIVLRRLDRKFTLDTLNEMT